MPLKTSILLPTIQQGIPFCLILILFTFTFTFWAAPSASVLMHSFMDSLVQPNKHFQNIFSTSFKPMQHSTSTIVRKDGDQPMEHILLWTEYKMSCGLESAKSDFLLTWCQMRNSWFYQAYFFHRLNNNLALMFCYTQRIIPSCEKEKPEDIKEVLTKYLKMWGKTTKPKLINYIKRWSSTIFVSKSIVIFWLVRVVKYR